ncbi:MAG: protein jag [Oscillospiraceae bacterium]|nr:protein jag [Oscillospiraceae bacterium]
MKREMIKTASTLDEAIELACLELNVSRDDVCVEVLEVPKKGFLGLGKVEAKVKVTIIEGDSDNPVDIKDNINKPEVDKNNINIINKLEVAKDYLYSLLDNMGLENFDIDVNEKSDKKVVFTLRGDNLGLVIGKRGDTLNALQQLCVVVANMSGGDYYNVIIDVGDYRETREQALRDLGTKISKTVLKNKKKISLEPMNAYERKIIHDTIQNINGVKSISKGTEPHRYIVVFPVEKRSFNKSKKKKRYSFKNNNFRYNKKYK